VCQACGLSHPQSGHHHPQSRPDDLSQLYFQNHDQFGDPLLQYDSHELVRQRLSHGHDGGHW